MVSTGRGGRAGGGVGTVSEKSLWCWFLTQYQRLQNNYFIRVVKFALNIKISRQPPTMPGIPQPRARLSSTNGRVDICSNETNGFPCPSSIYLPLRSPTTEKESADRSIDIDENEKSRPPSQIDGIIRDRIERRETSTDPLSFNRVSLDVKVGRGRGRTESIIFVWTVSDESGEADTGESDCEAKK